ncbi:MAG: ATP-binding protein [Lewinellaceae bacterium]|nr:ATP-binding protein [Lewinellaceae bacterium]
MIERLLRYQIENRWSSGKAIIILGPRQVGKTTLIRQICAEKGDYLFLNADETEVPALLENANELRLRQIIGKKKVLFIDEAQRIRNIGLTLKIITDQIPEVKVLASGSSSLDLASEISEPLTGRKWEFLMFPISWEELVNHTGYPDARKQLEQRMIFGMYPEVINQAGDEREVLHQLSNSYLYRDILQYGGIRKPEMLEKLLTALALQIGSEVSYNELSQLLQIDRSTVEQYIALLEKSFIVFRLSALSRNLRNEINTSRKVYFYDNGIRNAVLADFKPLALRADAGALWENFLVSERKKYLHYKRIWAKTYFWRTYQQQEIDYVEESDGAFSAWQMKWNPKAKSRFPPLFFGAYQPVETGTLHRENFDDFLLGK